MPWGALKCHKLKNKKKIKHILNIKEAAYPTTETTDDKILKHIVIKDFCSISAF